jgi:fluoroquinolone resistance protein
LEKPYITNDIFKEKNFSETLLAAGDYESCTFINCNFSNTDLSGTHFTDSTFTDCNFSMAKLNKTALQNIQFTGCKLMGLHFDSCNSFLFEVHFDNCILNLSVFYALKLKNTIFKNSSLHEVDFTEADLSNAVFNHCDLTGATFDNTILENADFRTAYNYSINPGTNRIKKAKFSKTGLAGLLDQYDIVIE